MKKKIHLIACGGTALTLLGLKESTKDIDLIVPEIKEYEYLKKRLKDMGYKEVTPYGLTKDKVFIFDLFPGDKIYTTELLESPLKKGNNLLYKEFSSVYLGILNFYDLIISKIFRCSSVDLEDCRALFQAKNKEIDINKLKERYIETAKYDISEEKCLKNLEIFLEDLRKEGIKI